MVYITGYMSDYIELHSAQSTVVTTGSTSILLPSLALKGYVAQFDMVNGELYFVEEVSVPTQTGTESYTECRAITVDETNGELYVGGRRCDAAYNGSAGTPKSGYFVYKYVPTVLGGSANALGAPVWMEYYSQYFYDQINDMDFDEVHNRVWFTGKFHKVVYHNSGGLTGFNHDAFIGAFNGTTGASVSIGGISSWRAGKCTINGVMDGNGVSIDANLTHDLYKFDDSAQMRINELDSFPRLTGIRLATNFTLLGKTNESQPESEKEFSDRTKEFLTDLSGNSWQSKIGISYTVNKINPSNTIENFWVNTNTSMNVTQNWKLNYNARFSISDKNIVRHNITLYREIDCWELFVDWTPTGYAKGLYFRLNLKSDILKDLKVEQKTGLYNTRSSF